MIALEKPSSLFLRRPRQDPSQPHAVRQLNLASFRMHRFLYFLIFFAMCCVQFLGTKVVVVKDNATIATKNGKTKTIVTSRSPSRDTVPTIAFVVTITGCGDGSYPSFDGAAVLGHSIHQNSIRGPNGGRYDYQLYAFHHPDAAECSAPLSQLGYIVQERDTPVTQDAIRNKEFATNFWHAFCCGAKELIKFEAFTLVQYPIVVLLDIDTFLMKPMDRLFDFMLDTTKLPLPDDLMFVDKPAYAGRNTNVTVPKRMDLLYTTDYFEVEAGREIKAVQGG
jgi:hypothetical protein